MSISCHPSQTFAAPAFRIGFAARRSRTSPVSRIVLGQPSELRTRTSRKLAQPIRRLPGRPHHRLGPIATDVRAAPDDGGYITAETALALPSLVLVFCSLLLVVLAAGVQLRCGDAAWEAARLAARGEPIDLVEDQVKPWTPTGSDVSVKQDQGGIQAIVSVRLGLPGARLPAIRVSSTAFVACESGLPCASEDP